jgi:hypothetical protein
MEYTFFGKLSFDDYVQLNRHFLLELFFKRKLSIIYISLFSIIIIGISGLNIYNAVINNKDINIFTLSIPVFIITLFYFIINRPKAFFKKYYESNKLSIEEQQFIINEKEITIKTDSVNAKITKDKIYKIRTDKDSIYIYMGINSIYTIKRGYLKSNEEFHELRDFIIKYYQ